MIIYNRGLFIVYQCTWTKCYQKFCYTIKNNPWISDLPQIWASLLTFLFPSDLRTFWGPLLSPFHWYRVVCFGRSLLAWKEGFNVTWQGDIWKRSKRSNNLHQYAITLSCVLFVRVVKMFVFKALSPLEKESQIMESLNGGCPLQQSFGSCHWPFGCWNSK